MSVFGRARAWTRAIVQRNRLEREMREEMASHIAQAADRFVARGLSERDALRAARREFGHVGALENSGRDAFGGQWVDNLLTDLKYALRYFARAPLSTATIVLTLAIGIGFSSAVFATVNGMFTNPAPGVPPDPALVKIRGLIDVPREARLLPYGEFTAYAGLTGTFQSVAGGVTRAVVVDVGDRERGVMSSRAVFVTPNYFATLGVRPAAGRGFGQTRLDERSPPELTAIISDDYAAEMFGGARDALGRRVKVNGVEVTIIGVAPPRFNGPVQSGHERTLWLPLSSMPLVARLDAEVLASGESPAFDAFARLGAGVTIAEALSTVRVVAARMDAERATQLPRKWTGTADVVPLRGFIEVGRYGDDLGPTSVFISVVALLVLLVCTTTVNSLLVGAAVARRFEIGVRLALGASRARIVRQLLTEITILSLAGGALGMWVFGALSRLTEVAQDGFQVSPDWRTTAFMLAYAMLTATLCGLSPALHATRTGLSDVLKDSQSGRKSRLQRTFVVAQIAIAQPLMVILAATITNVVDSIPSMGNQRLRERVLIADLNPSIAAALNEPNRMPGLVRRLEQMPGVAAVLPLGPSAGGISLEPADSAMRALAMRTSRASLYEVPAGYFRAVEARVVSGREFVASDTALSVLPAIISDSLARELFGTSNPIGQRIRRLAYYDQPVVELDVVGVVAMKRETNTLEYPSDYPPVFVPYKPRIGGLLLIRTTGPAEKLIPAVMRLVREEAPLVPLEKVRTLAQSDRLLRDSRLGAFGAIAGFGMIALLFAAVGLYAMLSIAVGQRRREIGVRIALGARAREVVMLFFASGLRTTLFGLALGLPLSIAGLMVMSRAAGIVWIQLPAIAGLVALAVVIVASLASWLPARKAAHVDPMLALRSE